MKPQKTFRSPLSQRGAKVFLFLEVIDCPGDPSRTLKVLRPGGARTFETPIQSPRRRSAELALSPRYLTSLRLFFLNEHLQVFIYLSEHLRSPSLHIESSIYLNEHLHGVMRFWGKCVRTSADETSENLSLSSESERCKSVLIS